jgi:hypothetical protein
MGGQMFRKILLSFIALTAIIFSACGTEKIYVQGNDEEQVTLGGGPALKVTLPGSAAANQSILSNLLGSPKMATYQNGPAIVKYRVQLSSATLGYDETKEAAPGAVVVFSNLLVGTYSLKILGYDSADEPVAGGEAVQVSIKAGQTTRVIIEPGYFTGTVNVEIQYPQINEPVGLVGVWRLTREKENGVECTIPETGAIFNETIGGQALSFKALKYIRIDATTRRTITKISNSSNTTMQPNGLFYCANDDEQYTIADNKINGTMPYSITGTTLRVDDPGNGDYWEYAHATDNDIAGAVDTPSIPPDQYEPDNIPNIDRKIVVGAPPEYHTLDPNDNGLWETYAMDCLMIDGITIGDTISVETYFARIATDTAIFLIDENWNEIMTNDDKAENDLYSKIVWTVDGAGPYFVIILDGEIKNDGRKDGDYLIDVKLTSK